MSTQLYKNLLTLHTKYDIYVLKKGCDICMEDDPGENHTVILNLSAITIMDI